MTEYDVLETMVVHRPRLLAETIGSETTVICGTPRGNTSAVAYTFWQLDYFLGWHIGQKNHEDQEILDLLPEPKSDFDPRALATTVASRNQQFQRWGFKVPRATEYIEELSGVLRNPVFVICFRNPVGVVRSTTHREEKRFRLDKLLAKTARSIDAAITAVTKTTAPVVLIDTERAFSKPRNFVAEISSLWRLDGDVDSISAALSKPGYKHAFERDGVTIKPQ